LKLKRRSALIRKGSREPTESVNRKPKRKPD